MNPNLTGTNRNKVDLSTTLSAWFVIGDKDGMQEIYKVYMEIQS